MTSSRPDRRRPPAGDSRLLALAPALSLAALLTLVDIVVQPPTAIIGFVVLAPLLTALLGSRTTVDVAPGDVLVLYTDGVFDTVGADGRFGEERLQQTVAGVGDAVDAVARIDEALSRFEVGEQADDTAVLAVQRAVVPAAIGGGPRRRAQE